MATNNYIVQTLITEVDGFSEVVTLAEVKAFLRISNTAEDILLNRLIQSCRQAAELWTGRAFVRKTCTVQLYNQCGGMRLPYPPVDVSTVTIASDEVNTNMYGLSAIDGDAVLSCAYEKALTIGYNCGYTTTGINAAYATVPAGIKDGILAEINHRWQNRGQLQQHGVICREAMNYLGPYKVYSL